ncbi:MAG TPA: SUMF1/EgtB/PvdO family nonheme iron enzyme [Terriglobia bacterium]|nr:SUMF1/EgtB/PvdO family nonheme iron enzyme [Terriglobia bacterium]
MLASRKAMDVKAELLNRLTEARVQTDRLFEVVRPDSLYERPIAERHRIVFYLGHLEAFDWNLLRERMLGVEAFHPQFDQLFAFGIDPVDGGLPSDQPQDWPSLSEVRSYHQRIRETLDAKLPNAIRQDSATAGNELTSSNLLLNVAIEHRLMHAETLAYMLHQLPLDRKIPRLHTQNIRSAPVAARLVEIPAGSATLGLSRNDGTTFGWDNEFECHQVMVPSFEIDQYKVTNGQYLQFMIAGGYEDPTLWSEDAWAWRTSSAITHPAFWKRVEDRWHFKGMFQEFPLPLDGPAYVSHAEASAYARWVGKALPTEAQWHRAAYGARDGLERAYPWGDEFPQAIHGNFDFQSWDPTPVNAHPSGRSGFGVSDLLGNGWEWTSTVFQPFEGFRPFPFYPGYSANFFDGKHSVMKGGSARTAACILRRSFRNWFQPNYPYIYAGFRCVRS